MKLTDKIKHDIMIAYAEGVTKTDIAKAYDISYKTVDRLIKSDEMSELSQLVQQKKEESAADIFDFMDKCRPKVLAIVEKYLDALADDEKIELSTVSQLTTALGTLIDKWTMARNNGTGGEVRLAYIAKQDEPEQPPAEIEDEDEADE